MFDEILVCFDGSPLAEKMLPLARGIAATTRARLAFIRVVADSDALAAEETYLRDLARQYGAEMRFLASRDAAGAVIADLDKAP